MATAGSGRLQSRRRFRIASSRGARGTCPGRCVSRFLDQPSRSEHPHRGHAPAQHLPQAPRPLAGRRGCQGAAREVRLSGCDANQTGANEGNKGPGAEKNVPSGLPNPLALQCRCLLGPTSLCTASLPAFASFPSVNNRIDGSGRGLAVAPLFRQHPATSVVRRPCAGSRNLKAGSVPEKHNQG